MRLIILSMWCCLITLSLGYADEKRDELRVILPEALANLTQTSTQLHAAFAAIGFSIPNAFDDVLVVRRTIAADWANKLNDSNTAINYDGALRFHHELQSLNNTIRQLINTANQIAYSAQQFPHCLEEPFYKKYRMHLESHINACVNSVVVGKVLDNDRIHSVNQQRYSNVLLVIEAQHACAARFNVLSTDFPLLQDYQTYLRISREQLESTIEIPDKDRNNYKIQEITRAFEALLDTEVHAIKRVRDAGLADTAPAVIVYQSAVARQRITLQELLTLARSDNANDEEHYKRQQAAQYKDAISSHLVNICERWMINESERKNRHEKIKDNNEDFSEKWHKRLNSTLQEFDNKRRASEQELRTAIKSENAPNAMAQLGALESINFEEVFIVENAMHDAHYDSDEEAWKKFEKDPDVAKLIKQYQDKKTAFLKARNDAHQYNQKINAQYLAMEISELQSELLGFEADRLNDESYELVDQIDEAAEAVRDAIELRGGDEK